MPNTNAAPRSSGTGAWPGGRQAAIGGGGVISFAEHAAAGIISFGEMFTGIGSGHRGGGLGVAFEFGGSFGTSFLGAAFAVTGYAPVTGFSAGSGIFIFFGQDGIDLGAFSEIGANAGVGQFAGLGVTGTVFGDMKSFAGHSMGGTLQGGAFGKYSVTAGSGFVSGGYAAGGGVFFGAVQSETTGVGVEIGPSPSVITF